MSKDDSLRATVELVFRTLMEDRGTAIEAIDQDRILYENGYGLDSMDTATLSAMLSERFGDDPYATGVFPQTLKEIVNYYCNRPAS